MDQQRLASLASPSPPSHTARTVSSFHRRVVSLSYFCYLYLVSGNITVIPLALRSREVAAKHVLASRVRWPCAQALSACLATVPIAVLECIIVSSCFYFMAGLVPNAESYSLFLGVAILVDVAMAGYFRCVAWLSGSRGYAFAQSVALGPLALIQLTNGFVVTHKNLSPLFQGIYWANPLAHGIRAVAIDQFQSPRYDHRLLLAAPLNGSAAIELGPRAGDAYLAAF